MELFGAFYDSEAMTICDSTPCSEMGYRPFLPLYASVAIIDEDDSYEKELHNQHRKMGNTNKLRIPSGFVAVPL